jgi:protein-arginine kinase activator protein McsA
MTKMDKCPYCNNKYLYEDYNLLKKFPIISLDWDYNKNILTPEKYFPHSHKKAYWKCHKCNFEWKAFISNRTGVNKVGCPNCYPKSKGEVEINNVLLKYNIDNIR